MYIIVNKDNNIIVKSSINASYVMVLNDDYVVCDKDFATAILVADINTVFPTSLFDMYDIDNTGIIDGFSQYVNGMVSVSDEMVNMHKAQKLNELSEACEHTILDGIDVTTSNGVEHFSLEITDQIEITNQFAEVLRGATQVLYHADGNGGNCRLFSAAEMTDIATAARSFVTYNKTYFNELKALTYRVMTIEEIDSIHFGMPLPEDLDAHLVSLTGKSSRS